MNLMEDNVSTLKEVSFSSFCIAFVSYNVSSAVFIFSN